MRGVGGGEKGHQNNTAERVSLSFSVIWESVLTVGQGRSHLGTAEKSLDVAMKCATLQFYQLNSKIILFAISSYQLVSLLVPQNQTLFKEEIVLF